MRDNGMTQNYPTSTAAAAAVALLCYDTCLLTTNKENCNLNTIIVDSGASAHMVHSKSLLTNFQEKRGTVKIGDNTVVKSLGTGTFMGYHLNKEGKSKDLTLHDELLVPDLWVNLFSITKATSAKSCQVVCEDNLINSKYKIRTTIFQQSTSPWSRKNHSN
jgi:hypothetical protein